MLVTFYFIFTSSKIYQNYKNDSKSKNVYVSNYSFSVRYRFTPRTTYMISDLPTRSESISCTRNTKTHILLFFYPLEFKVFNYRAQTDYPTFTQCASRNCSNVQTTVCSASSFNAVQNICMCCVSCNMVGT